jgi:hypothetical protein
MSTVENVSIGDKVAVVRAGANLAITAGAGQDGQAQTGVIIDRAAFRWANSAVVALPYTATLAANETLSVGITVQDGDNSGLSDVGTFRTLPSGVVATGPSGGGTVSGVVEFNIGLGGAKRYVRVNYTPDLSRANTDTAALSVVAVLAGSDRLPI